MIKLSQLFSRSSKTRRDRNRLPQTSVVAAQQSEVLENRALLTIGIKFDLTIIGSDLSETLRYHGSTDPADAPFETLRHVSGTATELIDFDGGEILMNPGDLTFEVGSMDPANTDRSLTLETFDDGADDGVANAVYMNPTSSETFFRASFQYKGEEFAYGGAQQLDLDTTSNGTTTGVLWMHSISSDRVGNEPRAPLANFLNFLNTPNHPRYLTEFDLGTFDGGTAWPGSADGIVFQTNGTLISNDTVPSIKEFAVNWDSTVPVTIGPSQNYDWFKTDLDRTREYTLRVTPDDTSGELARIRIEDANGQQLGTYSSSVTPEVTFTPVTSMTFVEVIAPNKLSYTLEVVSSAPKSLSVALAGTDITWTPEYDSNSTAIPADGYRVIVESANAIIYQQDVDGSTLGLSLNGHLGLSYNSITVSRLVAGEVAATGDITFLAAVDGVRATAATFDSATNTLSWAPVAGAERYELYFGPGDIRRSYGTSYTLPASRSSVEWQRVWVRGIGNETGRWSPPANFHPRAAVTGLQVNVDNPLRPQLSWAQLNADGFEVFITNATTGQSGVIRETGIQGTTWTSSNDLSVGNYRAWVRAVGSTGVTGKWSTAVTFSISPQPVSTTVGASILRPVLTWTEVPGVESVDLYIYNGSAPTVLTGLTGTSWESPTDLSQGVIRWWVKGTATGGGQTNWSTPQTSSMGGRVQLSGPSGTVSATPAPVLSWSSALGAERYEVLVRGLRSGDRTFSTTDTTFQLDPANGDGSDRFKVWVNTIYPSGENFWSNRLDFDVESTYERVLITPSGASESATPTLTWLPDRYRRDTQIWTRNEDTGENQPLIRTSGSSYTYTEPLPPGNYRFWITQAHASRWSNSITLTISVAAADAPAGEESLALSSLKSAPLQSVVLKSPVTSNIALPSGQTDAAEHGELASDDHEHAEFFSIPTSC